MFLIKHRKVNIEESLPRAVQWVALQCIEHLHKHDKLMYDHGVVSGFQVTLHVLLVSISHLLAQPCKHKLKVILSERF